MDFFSKIYSYFYFQSWRYGLWTPPDRKILVQDILKPLAKDPRFQRILFIGVQDYCANYFSLFAGKEICTLDAAASVCRFGAPWHIVDTAENLRHHLPAEYQFDAIIINGVIGYGLDDHQEADRTLQMCLQSLSPQGVMVLGLNPEKTGRVEMAKLQSLSAASPHVWEPLGSRQVRVAMPGYRNWTHAYYFYQSPRQEVSC